MTSTGLRHVQQKSELDHVKKADKSVKLSRRTTFLFPDAV